MKNLLFVEDDPNLSCIVVDNLEDMGFNVFCVTSGEQALELLNDTTVDVILMDVELAGELNGFETAERVRATNPLLPIIFATARHSGEDIERGFRLGRIEYVKKPYRMKEISLRIDQMVGETYKKDSLIPLGKFTFDPVLRRLFVNNKEIRLSNLESNLLAILCENENKIVNKDQLIQSLWGAYDDPKSKENSIHNIVYNVRKFLKEDPTLMLEVVSKQGYRIKTKQMSDHLLN